MLLQYAAGSGSLHAPIQIWDGNLLPIQNYPGRSIQNSRLHSRLPVLRAVPHVKYFEYTAAFRIVHLIIL